MKITVKHDIDEETIKKVMMLYLYSVEKKRNPTKEGFIVYLKQQLELFGTEMLIGENFELDKIFYPDPDKYYEKWFTGKKKVVREREPRPELQEALDVIMRIK